MREALGALRLMVQISWRADRARSILAVLAATGQNAAPPLTAIGLRMFANGIASHSVSLATRGVAVTIAIDALGRFSRHASFNIRFRLRENTELYLDTYLMELTAGIPDLEHHESSTYLDQVELLRNERGYLANPFNPISWTTSSVIQTAVIVALLGHLDLALMVLPLAGLPIAIFAGRNENRRIALLDCQAEAKRHQRHIEELLTEPPAAKEIRLYRLTTELLRRRHAAFQKLETEELALARRAAVSNTLAMVLFSAGFAFAMFRTVHLATHGHASVGDVVLVLGLGSQLDRQLLELGQYVGWFARTHRAVRRLRWFQDYATTKHSDLAPSSPRSAPLHLSKGIAFRDVSFTYPGTTHPVLQQMDLDLPAGSTVAIVGENGSGKTTLVKLLCRFYEPTTGVITIDGDRLSEIEIDEWRARVSASFQDFARIELVAREVVRVGDLGRPDDDATLQAALHRVAAGDVLRELPYGFATQLGRQFAGGVDLSLGQWQKLALGRASMRGLPLLLVLDEPTASLDAATEHALFERFHGVAQEAAKATGAITLLVSHRFSTVRMADLILVVADGRITEAGNHAQLVALNGQYAELYRLQARAYS